MGKEAKFRAVIFKSFFVLPRQWAVRVGQVPDISAQYRFGTLFEELLRALVGAGGAWALPTHQTHHGPAARRKAGEG